MLNLPSDVFIFIRSSEKHANVIDNKRFTWLQVDKEAAFGVLLDGDFSSSLFRLDYQPRCPS
jgi:hypothetical protein